MENVKNNIRLWTQEIDQKLQELLQSNQIPDRFRKKIEQAIQDKEREKEGDVENFFSGLRRFFFLFFVFN